MLSTLIEILAKFSAFKNILELISKLNELIKGHRTEILVVLKVIIALLKKYGLIQGDILATADAFDHAINGAIPITMVEKISNSVKVGGAVIDAVPTQELPK